MAGGEYKPITVSRRIGAPVIGHCTPLPTVRSSLILASRRSSFAWMSSGP
jgi:hypothetical protein